MSNAAKLEARLLTTSELELVASTRAPEIERQSDDELKATARRLREAAKRAKTIAARQTREIRGKSQPRGAGRRRTTSERSEKPRLWARRSSASRPNSAGARRWR